mmetsp:Transcript_14209/g.36298  ORF Transcript_14209/g.36298 Transcript_14209/m.36298 type:complete len:230 (+) Transcript_14209:521-1210(+)
MNAPSVSLSPIVFVNEPAAATVSRHSAIKVSEDRAPATALKIFGRRMYPKARSAVRPPIAVPNRVARSCVGAAAAPSAAVATVFWSSTMGRRTRRGTTAMSCRRRTPRAALPVGEPSWPFSWRILRTNAEEERERAAPMTNASSSCWIWTRSREAPNTVSSTCDPPMKGTAQKAAVVRATCNVPSPKANLKRLRSRSTVSSSPCSKRRKRIPISPSVSRSDRSLRPFRP